MGWVVWVGILGFGLSLPPSAHVPLLVLIATCLSLSGGLAGLLACWLSGCLVVWSTAFSIPPLWEVWDRSCAIARRFASQPAGTLPLCGQGSLLAIARPPNPSTIVQGPLHTTVFKYDPYDLIGLGAQIIAETNHKPTRN